MGNKREEVWGGGSTYAYIWAGFCWHYSGMFQHSVQIGGIILAWPREFYKVSVFCLGIFFLGVYYGAERWWRRTLF